MSKKKYKFHKNTIELSHNYNFSQKSNLQSFNQDIDFQSVYDIIKEERINNITCFLVVDKITRNKIRTLIGKWFPPTNEQMTINEVVDDIYKRIYNMIEGRTNYYTGRASFKQNNGRFEYFLIIKQNKGYFFNPNRGVCYILKMENRQ